MLITKQGMPSEAGSKGRSLQLGGETAVLYDRSQGLTSGRVKTKQEGEARASPELPGPLCSFASWGQPAAPRDGVSRELTNETSVAEGPWWREN